MASALSMAMVAAAVGSGTARPPRLVAGTPDDSAPGQAVPASAMAELRPMMASAVPRFLTALPATGATGG